MTEPIHGEDEFGNHYINAASMFRDGMRVLQLVARNKDGAEGKRTIHRVSRDGEHFAKLYAELRQILRPGERIYVTAAPRDVRRAAMGFAGLQAKAQFEWEDPMRFYTHMGRYWVSCLMKSPSTKVWMMDIDTDEDRKEIEAFLYRSSRQHRDWWNGLKIAEIPSKSGSHLLMRPFNRNLVSRYIRGLIHQDPLVLLCHKPA